MTTPSPLGQLVRYLVVGIGSNALLYLAYLALTAVGMDPKLAMTLLYALGVIQTFVFNKHWSFRHVGKHGPAFVRYGLAYALGYIVNLSALMLLVDQMGLSHQWVQGAMIVVVALLLFLAQRYWVFPQIYRRDAA